MLDPLANQEPGEQAQLIQKLGHDPDAKTILYAPTFYPSSLSRTLPYLPKLAEKSNVVVKLHNFSWFQKRYRYQNQEVAEVARRHPRIYLLPAEEYNIVPYYRLAHVLISDISSTLFEFLALNRPVIKTEYISLRLRHRLFPWRIRQRIDRAREAAIDFAYRLNSPGQCGDLVTHALQHTEEMAAARENAAAQFLHQLDGKASARLVDAIEERLTEMGRR